MKVASFDGNGNTIGLSIKMTRYRRDYENYFHTLNKSESPAFNGVWPDNYSQDEYKESLYGLGLFDMTWTQDVNSYYENFTLTGNIFDVCYDTNGNDVTGKDGNSQLYAVGGVVGQGYYGFYQNFDSVYFDGLTLDGAFSCGGLIGMNSDTTGKDMTIKKCNSVNTGISVTGGYYAKSDQPRCGIGSFVGVSIGTTVKIDGADSEEGIEKADIKVDKLTTHWTGNDNRATVGGLVGFTGQGAEIKNVNIVALNDDSVIGQIMLPIPAEF